MASWKRDWRCAFSSVVLLLLCSGATAQSARSAGAACLCLVMGDKCGMGLEELTSNTCKAGLLPQSQEDACHLLAGEAGDSRCPSHVRGNAVLEPADESQTSEIPSSTLIPPPYPSPSSLPSSFPAVIDPTTSVPTSTDASENPYMACLCLIYRHIQCRGVCFSDRRSNSCLLLASRANDLRCPPPPIQENFEGSLAESSTAGALSPTASSSPSLSSPSPPPSPSPTASSSPSLSSPSPPPSPSPTASSSPSPSSHPPFPSPSQSPSPAPSPSPSPTVSPPTTSSLPSTPLSPETKLAQAGICVEKFEETLASDINEYRARQGLPKIPVSRSLSKVAQLHAYDLEVNDPAAPAECNLHSWSDTNSLWNPVCYTRDHKHASGMWNKPREITNGIYSSHGFEISYYNSWEASPENALRGWQRSSTHLDVILERGRYWTNRRWPAFGVGMTKRYAVVWFGSLQDPAGTINRC